MSQEIMVKNVGELITLNLLDDPEHPVNARDLHAFLGVDTKFTDWIKRRIDEYGFTQVVDFSTNLKFEKRGENTNLGARTTEYWISIEMAKELAMVERNDNGKQARRYFIECEKKLKEKQLQPQPVQKLEYTPAQRALVDAKALFELSGLFKVNPSFAMQEIAKMVTRSSGCDITPLLTQSTHMNDVPDKDVMLEPTELAAHFGLDAKAMNIKLMEFGLQVKEGRKWIATPRGEKISERHAWVVAKKSGYNLKWNLAAVSRLMSEEV